VDRIWEVAFFVVLQLSCAKQEWQMLIVIQAPHAMRACWLKEIISLNPSHEFDISLEDDINERRKVIDSVKSNLAHAIQEYVEVQLVSCAIVNSLVGTKRFE
jgi:hypothetical protein